MVPLVVGTKSSLSVSLTRIEALKHGLVIEAPEATLIAFSIPYTDRSVEARWVGQQQIVAVVLSVSLTRIEALKLFGFSMEAVAS